MLSLRDYQQEAIEAVVSTWREGRGLRQLLISLPTGTGKTVVMAALSKRLNRRTLILAHRDELVQQAVAKCRFVVGQHVPIGIVKGKTNEPGAQIVVASVQTLMRESRLSALLAAGRFDLVLIDECHHYISPSYFDVLAKLGAQDPGGPLVVGFTATPHRGDHLHLGDLFDRVVYSRSILEMVEQNYLCDLKGMRVHAGMDFSAVKTSQGDDGDDYDERSLSKLMNQPWVNDLVVKTWLKEAVDRKTIAFACSIEHADALAAAFTKAGIKAATVHGQLPEKERRARLKEFEEGATQVLCNMNLLTEGYDCPVLSCVLMLRPTKSHGLYTQMVGRGTRKYPGKTDCLVMDFVGTSALGIQTLPGLFGLLPADLARQDGSVARATRKKRQESEAAQAAKTEIYGKKPLGLPSPKGQPKAEAVDMFDRSQFRWLEVEKEVLVLVGGDAGNVYLVHAVDNYWKSYVVKGKQIISLTPEPIAVTYASGAAEDYIRQQDKVALAKGHAFWRSRPAKEKQLNLLKQLGNPVKPGMTAGQASDVLTLQFARRDLQLIRTGTMGG